MTKWGPQLQIYLGYQLIHPRKGAAITSPAHSTRLSPNLRPKRNSKAKAKECLIMQEECKIRSLSTIQAAFSEPWLVIHLESRSRSLTGLDLAPRLPGPSLTACLSEWFVAISASLEACYTVQRQKATKSLKIVYKFQKLAVTGDEIWDMQLVVTFFLTSDQAVFTAPKPPTCLQLRQQSWNEAFNF